MNFPGDNHTIGLTPAGRARLVAFFLLLTSLLGVNLPCFGQAFTASLTGVFTDPSGAVVPEARVQLTSAATNEKRTTIAGSSGRYTFSQLLPGSYELAVEAAGFKKFVQQGINLRANETAELSVTLQVGAVTEQVDVTASAALLDSQTADQSIRIETNTMQSLPINTRTPFAMIWANAGISEAFDIRNSTGDQNFDRFGMNGGRTESTLILIDGVSGSTGSQWNGLFYSPTLDAVQEVQIVRNSYDAQFGKSGGGVFSVVTKGGSNEFHGAAFDFLRNSKLDANSFFNNRNGAPKPFFSRNQFGGTLAGPILKSKRVFFMGSYEGLRQGSPASRTSTVPTELQRQGDFSQTFNPNGTPQLVYDPFSTQPDGRGGFVRSQFPGNIIPQSRWDSVGAKVAALYPHSNRAGNAITNANNWFGTGKSTTSIDRYDARADWVRSDKHSLYFRWSQAWQVDHGLAYKEWGIAETSTYSPNPRGQATFGNTFMLSPTFVFNVLIGHGNWTEQTIPNVKASPTQVGFPAAQVARFHVQDVMPSFTVSQFATLGVGNNGQLRHPERTETAQVNFTKQRNTHSIKFGFTTEYGYMNGPGDGGWLRAPSFTFDQGLTSGPTVLPGTTTSGNGFASLLLGVGSGSAPYPASENESHHYYGLYIQDAWRVNSRLTVNLGIRYDLQKPTTDRYDRYSTFNFATPSPIKVPGLDLKGSLTFVDSNRRGSWDTDKNDFGPRVSLAYKITDKLVFRTGYGIFYVPLLGSGNLTGFSTSTPWQGTVALDGIHPQYPISNPFPDGFVPAIAKSQGDATGLGQGITSYPRNHPNGYIQNYSADFQFEVSRNTVLEIGYSGNQSRKLPFGYGVQLDQLPSKYLGLGTQLNAQVPNPFFGVIPASQGGTLTGPTVPAWRLLVPFPQYTGVSFNLSTPSASANYNALIAKFTKRFSNGLNLVTSYQWSKAIDNASETQGWEVGDGLRDAYNWNLERSISAHDIPHSLVVTTLYELPVGRGKALGSNLNSVGNALLGGWQISGMIRLQTGTPMNYSAPGLGFGFGYNPPNITKGSDVPIDNRKPERWFNTAAFSQPAPFVMGTAPRRITDLRQDGVHSADVGLMKNITLREPVKLQIRAESFNLTNTPQFGRPNTTVNSATFGQVTGTWSGPRNVQLGLRLSF